MQSTSLVKSPVKKPFGEISPNSPPRVSPEKDKATALVQSHIGKENSPTRVEAPKNPLTEVQFQRKIYDIKTVQVFQGIYQNREVAIKFDSTPLGKAEVEAMRWLQEKTTNNPPIGPIPFDEEVGDLPEKLSIFPGVPLLFAGEAHVQEMGPATYIVTPYYTEGDLFGLIDQQGPLSLNFIRPAAYQLLYYLATLETQNKIHCDIKPENIFLDNSTIRVADPAMMQDLIAQEQMGPGTFFGSRPYMAPEIILNTRDFGKIDVWSAGITLLAIATGDLLFNSDDTMDPTRFQKERLFQSIQVLGPVPGLLLEKVNVAKIGIEGVTQRQSTLGNLLKRDGSYAGPAPEQLSVDPISIDGLLETVYGPNTDTTPWSSELCNFSDLLHEMIAWDPNRIRARAALNHPFFQ